jgi:hypothetical protein
VQVFVLGDYYTFITIRVHFWALLVLLKAGEWFWRIGNLHDGVDCLLAGGILYDLPHSPVVLQSKCLMSGRCVHLVNGEAGCSLLLRLRLLPVYQ